MKIRDKCFLGEGNYTIEHFRRIILFLLFSFAFSLPVTFSFSTSFLYFLSCCLLLRWWLRKPHLNSPLLFVTSYQGKCIRIKLARSFDSLSLLLWCQKRENGYLYGLYPQAAVTFWAKFLLKQWLIFLDWLSGKSHWTNPNHEWVGFP